MDARQTKGLEIAKDKRIRRVGDRWAVPSQAGQSVYVVNVALGTCSCPDHELRGTKCKHQWAIEYARHRVTSPDGATTVTETMRVTYSQNWPAYNAAQTNEKAIAQALLRDLCSTIVTPPHPGRGPKPLPMADAVYAAVMKVYTTFSGRRATTDLRECEAKGMVARAPSYNAVFAYMEKPELAPLLKALIEESAAPLASIETKFAVDSTGFGTAVYRRWFDHKYGREMKEHAWLKAHIATGVLTNVVTAVEVTDATGNDSPELPGLVAITDRRFTMAEVSGDKAYLSHANLAAIEAVGAAPFIPFKSNSRGEGSEAWRKLFHLYSYKRDEFLTHYHSRSNVETTFSMIKRKFGGAVRSKLPVAQANEVLCKVLCHNLAVLVHSMFDLGIEPRFGSMATAAH